MVKTLSFLSLLLLATTTFAVDANSAPDSARGVPSPPRTDELVVYERGNMPVVILAPHDGIAKPEGIPLRKRATRDVFTSKLARLLCSELAYVDSEGVRRRPHLVINLASRAVVDPNRSWERNLASGWFNTEGKRVAPPARAKRIHRDFHACADYAVNSVKANQGAGLLLDLHGLGASRSVDMYGYLVRARDLTSGDGRRGPSPNAALAKAIRERGTMRYAASLKRTDEEVANLLRGPQSLASLVDRAYCKLYPSLSDGDDRPRGRPATPSARFPNPKGADTPDRDTIYFNGAYDVFAHSSRQSGVHVDAIQIETTADARNSKTQRLRFARCMSTAVREFLRLHYDLDIASAAEPARAADGSRR